MSKRKRPPITNFKMSAARRKPLWECMKDYGVGDKGAEWPNNILSKRTVVYESGVIARRGDVVEHNVDPDELELCNSLARDALTANPHAYFDFGSEGGSKIWEFSIVANIDQRVRKRITPEFIRAKFGGALFPGVSITVEPLRERGIWWSEALRDTQGIDDADTQDLLGTLRDLVDWFKNRPEFVHTAFVRIGDRPSFRDMSESNYPEETRLTPSVFPRLILGLTTNGSLAGLYCYSVQT